MYDQIDQSPSPSPQFIMMSLHLSLDLSAVQRCSMADRHVIFEAEQSPRGGWQIKCHCPEGKIDYVTGFLDEQSIQNWLATEHRDHWLTMRGY